jgi:oligopeptidase A
LRRWRFFFFIYSFSMTNPLLKTGGLPAFDRIIPEHVEPAITQLLVEGRALVERLTDAQTPATWADFAAPLSEGLERLSWAWGVVGHLHSVNDAPAWRDAYNALLPEISRFYSELGQNLALFEKYKQLRASAEFATLNVARQRIIDNEIRDFRLSGAELPEADKPRFQAIQEEISSLAAKFAENLLDATNAFAEIVTDEKDLAGLPPEAIAAAREAAMAAGEETGWKFTLHAPSYLPVMQYADNRELRRRLYRAYATRASEFSDSGSKPEWDNTAIMTRLLKLRAEEARLLGYRNFAEVSLAPKMAQSPAEVLAFLRDMADKAKPFAEKDMQELSAFAADLVEGELQPWDVAYVSEKLLQERYAFSEQEVRPYFTEPKVVSGLFRVVEHLYGIHIQPDSAPVWHDSVRFYRIENAAGELIGQFYLDLYARETKRGGAWMDSAVSRYRKSGKTGDIQTPVAYLVCNLSKPVGDKPATFTHDEVQTLFHEAGHGFHHLLTRMEELGVSGISGVEWDAVELPSQFMENFCWEWEVIREMTAHVDTGEALPRALFDKMRAARNFQSGMTTVRQIEFALFDMLLHSEFDPEQDAILDLLHRVRQEVAVLFPPEWHRFPNSFAHIFGGGYAAGYYSYKWAEVLSADAYAAFEETGDPLDASTGQRFLDEILSQGGIRPALESFKAFRGRAPKPDALLRHSGMVTK